MACELLQSRIEFVELPSQVILHTHAENGAKTQRACTGLSLHGPVDQQPWFEAQYMANPAAVEESRTDAGALERPRTPL